MRTQRLTLALLLTWLLASCGHFGYEVKRQTVIHAIWDGSRRVERPLPGADTETFTVLKPYRYAKDKYAVYHEQSVIPGASPSTFALLNDWYAFDSERVFYDGAVLPSRDTTTFEVISGYWTRDKNDVYFLNRAIQACDPASFRVMYERWAADAQCAYAADAVVDGADLQSFHALSDDYAKDKHHVYAQVSSLVPLTERTTGESRNVVRNTVSRVREVDVESFSPSDNRTCTYDSRDRFRCYHRGEAVPCDCSE